MVGADKPPFERRSSAPPHAPAAPNMALSHAEQIAALREFVAQVGGLENAHRALEMLALLSQHT